MRRGAKNGNNRRSRALWTDRSADLNHAKPILPERWKKSPMRSFLRKPLSRRCLWKSPLPRNTLFAHTPSNSPKPAHGSIRLPHKDLDIVTARPRFSLSDGVGRKNIPAPDFAHRKDVALVQWGSIHQNTRFPAISCNRPSTTISNTHGPQP